MGFPVGCVYVGGGGGGSAARYMEATASEHRLCFRWTSSWESQFTQLVFAATAAVCCCCEGVGVCVCGGGGVWCKCSETELPLQADSSRATALAQH
mgnify:CR=1 FL=1